MGASQPDGFRRIVPARGLALALLGAAMGFVACGGAPPPSATLAPRPADSHAAPPVAGLKFDIGAIDPHADPCVDFYDFACGGWRASHPIPPDRTTWSRYAEMEVENTERERAIVEEATQAAAGASEAEKRIGAFYAACMDEKAVEARGLEPLRDLFAHIDAIRTPEDAMAVITELEAHDRMPLFSVSVDSDSHDSHRMMIAIDRGTLGMRTRDAYVSDDDHAKKRRTEYRAHLVRLFRAIEPNGDASQETERVLALETALATHAPTPVEQRDSNARYNPMTVGALNKRYPTLALPALLTKLGAPALDQALINVAYPAWLDAVEVAVSKGDLAAVRAYLRALATTTLASMLPETFVAERFEFEEREGFGAKEMKPRWKRCLSLLDRTIGDDVGRVFVARYFSADAKARASAMIDTLIKAYRADIESVDWLGASAKKAALEKLARSLVVIGGSNHPINFDGLVFRRDDLFGNVWRALALDVTREMTELSQPPDRERFFNELPQSTEGFGSKAQNATAFTAGFLQPPVFDARIDDAVNYGALGGVIGHELTHQLDDEGRKFDQDGELHPWWSPEDVARFETRTQCFVDEYSHYHAADGTPIDGKLTLGENLADNGGLRLSYAALTPSEVGPKIDGFTPAQRFFLAWGQIRCENINPEAERNRVLHDFHATGRARVDGVVSNMPEFGRAFSCAPSAPMNPSKRCALW